MAKTKSSIFILLSVLLLTLQATAWGAVPTVTQSVSLNPGWNAVSLEVQPLLNDPSTVFGSLPSGSSVWAWTGKNDSMQFIQDPSEAPVKTAKWLAIFTSGPASVLNSLHAINANSVYLINVPASNPPITIDIAGRPTIRHKGWVPDSFNLIGFDFAGTAPLFADFFAPSRAHKNQAIYRLDNLTGAWQMVNNPAATTMRSGEAFWIYCQSASDYQGPLTVTADGIDGLDFGAGITILTMTLHNANATEKTISVSQLSAANNVALAYQRYDVDSGKILTEPLSSMAPVNVSAFGSAQITLVVRRGSFSGPAASVLELTDGQGNRVRVPVIAMAKPINNYAGLWSGVATLNMVSQLSDSGSAPDFASGAVTPTATELSLNLILHQDSSGQVRFLKQAIMMYQNQTAQAGGRYVLLTDDKLIPNYSGVTQRDGARFGRRISAIGYDYSPSADTDFNDTALNCSGIISNTVVCQLVLESSSAYTQPTNPFLHRYHPDHDNLASDYTTFKSEVKQIARELTFEFSSTPKQNPSNQPPGWGVSVLGGTYTESITGLAKGPIKVQGDFTLKLASDVDLLNQ